MATEIPNGFQKLSAIVSPNDGYALVFAADGRMRISRSPYANSALEGGPVTLIYKNVTPVTSASTSKSTLMTYTLPAGALAVNGQGIRVVAFGSCKATANNKTVQIDFGSTAVTTTGAVANNAGHWIISADVFRVSATTQISAGAAASAGTTVAPLVAAPGETLSGTVVINVAATNVTDTDGTIAKGFMVYLID